MTKQCSRIFFFSSLDISGLRSISDGVVKKVLLEIKTLSRMGYDVDYIYRKDAKYYLKRASKTSVILDSSGVWRSDLSKLSRILVRRVDWQSYAYFYWRFEGSNYYLQRLIYGIKRQNSLCKIISEIPTFAKKWEPGTNIIGILKFYIKKINDRIFSNKIDLVVTFDDSSKIFGKETINIENFADVESLPVRTLNKTDGEFHILGIAMMTPSHGFDRVIRGISEYYKKNGSQKIIFHIIGKGPAENQLRILTEDLHLQNHVKFEGVKTTDEISEYVNLCDIAVGALAIFRKKCRKASELKIREYCSRCIPFIYSAYEPILAHCQWCMRIENNDTPVDIALAISFSEKVNGDSSKSNEMRNFALKNCTCVSQLEKIIKNRI